MDKGGISTSIEDVAKRAGIAKSTVFHYFSDRLALLEALRQRSSLRLASDIDAAMDRLALGDWDGRLTAWVSVVTLEIQAITKLNAAIFRDPRAQSRCLACNEPFVIQLAELLRHGSEAGAWFVEQPSTTAAFLYHGLRGLLGETNGSEAARIEQVTRLVRAAVTGCATPRPRQNND